eukprot:TRINITY_DN31_c0_g1_i5.p1 TRINITY_DN31_c0_g1~~TRINITY_DN31_c0_g1_i5.p1  ORF type:complete len:1582 (+),score=269.36 TRINITY_DN31_c0_g1_i5:725-5470(+)
MASGQAAAVAATLRAVQANENASAKGGKLARGGGESFWAPRRSSDGSAAVEDKQGSYHGRISGEVLSPQQVTDTVETESEPAVIGNTVTFEEAVPENGLLLEEGNSGDDANIVQAIYHKIRKTKVHKENYITLCSFVSFTCVYVVILFLQANQQSVYQVTTAHLGLLPAGLTGLGGFDFSTTDDVYNWLNQSILQTIWTDASCGNGVCERPNEFEAWGRFGCASDCGHNSNVSQIIVAFNTNFADDASMAASSWNLCMTSPSYMCWYSSPVVFNALTGSNSTSFSIPDGNWTLYLAAPFGGVTGSVVYNATYNWTTPDALTYGANLVSWGNCQPNITESPLVQCRSVSAYIASCTLQYCTDNGVRITSNASFSGLFMDLLSICNADFHALDAFIGFENCSAVAQVITVNTTSFGSIVCSDYASPPSVPSITSNTPPPYLSSSPPLPSPLAQRRKLLQESSLWSFSTFPHLADMEDVEEASRQQAQELQDRHYGGRKSKVQEDWSVAVQSGGTEGTPLSMGSRSGDGSGITSALEEGEATNMRRMTLAELNQSPSDYTGTIWKRLGGTNDDRLFNLQAAVQRAMYSWVKDACLANYPKNLNRTAQIAAFFCTLFGGPTTLDGCGYRNASNVLLTTDVELAGELTTAHAGMSITREQSDQFANILVWALQSMLFIEPSTKVAIFTRVHACDTEIVNEALYGCPYVPNVLPWSVGDTYTTSVVVGTGITWVWLDDEPHSIKSSALGDDPEDIFQGMGSGRLILSRNYLCTQQNVGPKNLSLAPSPCNLQDPQANTNAFTLTKFFYKAGNYSYEDSRYADTTYGEVAVVESEADASLAADLGSLSAVCNAGCKIGHLKNGRCDFSCNTYECAYDGGDCGCPVDSYGTPVCSCPTGQVKGHDGSCCQANAVGSNLQYNFGLLTWGPNVTINDHDFLPSEAPPLLRHVSVKNRVLIGMVLAQTRWASEECKDSRFFSIYPNCTYSASTAHYGVNPVFLPTSTLYDAYFAANASLYYANWSLGFDNSTLRNPQGVPYGFDANSLGVAEPTFHYLFDINYNAREAQESLQYMADGFFIDNATKQMTVQLITFNGVGHYFTLINVKLTFQTGGKIAVKYDINAINPQPYMSGEDWFRFALEVIFTICVIFNVFGEVKEFRARWRQTGNPLAHFLEAWNLVDLISLGIMIAGIILWALFIVNMANPFDINSRYEVYDIVSWIRPGQYWNIVKPGSGFKDAIKAFSAVEAMINFRALYFALQGINVLLMVLRILKLMDFQPRMGIITRTVAKAAPDLAHFFLFFFVIFFGFAVFGHLVFGRSIDQFRTMAISLTTCFEALSGDDSVNMYLVELEGAELLAGVLFWWSYIIIMVFVVLNLLIAIIVEAFVGVRQGTENAPSMPEEVLYMAKRSAYRFMTPLRTEGQLLNSLVTLGADRQKEMDKYGYLYDGGTSEYASSVTKGERTASSKVMHIYGQQLEKEELQAIFRRAAQQSRDGEEKASSSRGRTVDPELVADVVFSEFSVAPTLEHHQMNEEEKMEEGVEESQAEADVRQVKATVANMEATLQKLEEERARDRELMTDMMSILKQIAK